MVDFRASADLSGVEEIGSRLALMGRIAAASVNETATFARDESIDRITRHLNLREAYVKEKFSLRKAAPQNPAAVVIAIDRPVQIRQYDARQEFGAGGKRAGISVQVLRGGPRKTLRSAFFGTLRSGAGVGVYGRKSAARYPLRVLYAPSPGQMFFTITPDMTDDLAKRLVNDLLARTDGAFNTSGVSLGVSR